MNYAVFYFTGTGNTGRAVRLLSAELGEAGHTVDNRLIEPGAVPPSTAEEYDRMVVCFPVYSWAPPKIVKRFIRSIPRFGKPGIPAAVLAVDGGGGYQAAAQARRMLDRRGCRVFLSARAGYADNWRQMMNPTDEEKAALLNAEGDREVKEFARELAGEKTSHYRISRMNSAWSWCVGVIFAAVGRRLLATFFTADERCTSCGLCERTCPVQAIRMVPSDSADSTGSPDSAGRTDDSCPKAYGNSSGAVPAAAGITRLRPEWGGSCESCNRCINICPVQAINTSIFRMAAAVVMIAFFIFLLLRIFNAAVLPVLPPGLPGLPLLAILLKAALILAAHRIAAELMNPVCRVIGNVPGMRRVMAKSFNRNFRQYLAPGFRPR